MTNEEMCSALYRSLNIDEVERRNAASVDTDDTVSETSANSCASGGSLYRIIRRFENGDVSRRTSLVENEDAEDEDDAFGEKVEQDYEPVPIQPGTVNALRVQLFPSGFQEKPSRESSISVNSELSRVSTLSNSSAFSNTFLPHHEDDKDSVSNSPHISPTSLRRLRVNSINLNGSVHFSGNPNKEREKNQWSYGVSQLDLKTAFNRRKKSVQYINNNDSDSENHDETIREDVNEENSNSENTEDNSDSLRREAEAELNGSLSEHDSNDRSTDTLTYDQNNDSDHHDSGHFYNETSAAPSECSAERSNFDTYSNLSLSSFDIAPEKGKGDDCITISSDEFGSEMCDTPGEEYLSVNAVNECCIAQATDHIIIPIESKKAKHQRRLTERLNELVHTEVVYVDKLRHVVADYIPEMTRADIPSGIKGLKFDIFTNIERIYEFHAHHLLPALRDCKHDLKKLGKCFRSFEKKFQLYVMYSRNNRRSNRLVYENRLFFKEKQTALGDRLDLSSYLLEPIQRLPRYRLFLEDLVKTYIHYETELECESAISRLSDNSLESNEESPCDENDDAKMDIDNNNESKDDCETTLESLQQAKTMMEVLLRRVDDMIALEHIKNCPIDLLEQGRLLRQDEFVVIDSNRRKHLMRIFLFENIVLLTSIYRKQPTKELFVYRDSIPVSELGLTPREKHIDRFSIFWRKRTLKPYTIVTSRAPVRDVWVKDIMRLLWRQAELDKEMILKAHSTRDSGIHEVTPSSISDHDAEAGEGTASGEKYSSLRGVPGEARAPVGRRNGAIMDKKRRRTTWYCE